MFSKSVLYDALVILAISVFLISCFLYGTSESVWNCDPIRITNTSN